MLRHHNSDHDNYLVPIHIVQAHLEKKSNRAHEFVDGVLKNPRNISWIFNLPCTKQKQTVIYSFVLISAVSTIIMARNWVLYIALKIFYCTTTLDNKEIISFKVSREVHLYLVRWSQHFSSGTCSAHRSNCIIFWGFIGMSTNS